MNTKLFSISAAAVSSILAVSSASADVSLSAELVHQGTNGLDGISVATYRVYANMDSDWRVDAVFGNSASAMNIESTGSFYQNAAGGNTSKDINSAFFAFVPSIEWDSYVTIGSLYQDGSPFGENSLNNIGIDWSSFNAGGALSTDNGSWFVTPDDAQGGEIDGKVLLGQFSVIDGSGVLAQDMSAITMNVQGKDANGDTWVILGANALPAPGALALLGLAGIAAKRRRK